MNLSSVITGGTGLNLGKRRGLDKVWKDKQKNLGKKVINNYWYILYYGILLLSPHKAIETGMILSIMDMKKQLLCVFFIDSLRNKGYLGPDSGGHSTTTWTEFFHFLTPQQTEYKFLLKNLCRFWTEKKHPRVIKLTFGIENWL